MSGGRFDYKQYEFGYIADSIEHVILNNGREKTKEELKEEWRDYDWSDEYPEEKFYYKYPDEVIEKFKEGVEIIRNAQIYANRIDWLLSADDGEKEFLIKLDKDLKNSI